MRVHFGAHVLDLDRRELHRDGAEIVLEPRVFDLLVHLVTNRDRVVSKDELIEQVWKGRIVSDAAIDTAVKAARQAVGDSGAEQLTIKTIARKGVRFVAEIRAASPLVVVDANIVTAAPTLPDKPSIAVLPFTNMSGDPEQEYFADGITEDIITALSKWRWFFVIARNSTFVYKGRSVDIVQVGRDLGVRYVLEGSVRKIGNRVRVTAQLIDATTGVHIWAERYDRELNDVFAVQDDITQSVAGAIEPVLAHNEGARALAKTPDQLRAWDYRLRGIWHHHRYTPEDAAAGKICLARAIEIDPEVAESHVWYGRTHLSIAHFRFQGTRTGAFQIAAAAARRTLELDRDNALGHYVLSVSLPYLDGHEAALEHALRAIDLNPSLAVGHAAIAVNQTLAGRHEAALPYYDQAIRLSPNDSQAIAWWANRASSYYLLGRYEDALASARRSRGLRWYHSACRALAASLAQLGDIAGARAAVQEMLSEQSGDKTIAEAVSSFLRPEDRAHLADGLRKAGLPEG